MIMQSDRSKVHKTWQMLTFSRKHRVVLLKRVLQGEGDTQELDITVPVPDQQLLSRLDVLTGLIEDLTLALEGNQILFFWEARTLHQGHPVPRATPAVHKVTQTAILKHLNNTIQSLTSNMKCYKATHHNWANSLEIVTHMASYVYTTQLCISFPFNYSPVLWHITTMNLLTTV